ncbi:thaumatin-like protein 1b [Cucumis sativus]|uniref:Thaumatin-like protein n=1 Tax=Cucumis sativus TaxID=3659 RepID=A0A0A0L1P4_CUCSA|nr:thaumatin-like protein 1b [Cucumis sativus]
MATMSYSLLALLLSFPFLLGTGNSATFTILNQCAYTVWPGLSSGADSPQLSTTGFVLEVGKSNAITIPSGWSGRIWARTYCSQDSTGRFTCATADCGSRTIDCKGKGATPPATFAEITLNGLDGLDFYDISLVDGYNLPISITPQNGTEIGGGNCPTVECAKDINSHCPAKLRLTDRDGSGKGVACKSACEAFGDAKYCCSDEFGSPDTCKPSSYSQFFKSACPRAYTYAYEDGNTFGCNGANYLITFCPSPHWQPPHIVDTSRAERSRILSMFVALISIMMAALSRQFY